MTAMPAESATRAASEGASSARYRRAGPFVFVAGTGAHGGGDIRAQTAATIEALRAILEEAGGGLENMVDLTTYLVNMGDFAGYNDIYSTYFSPDGPARTTVAVHHLARPDQLIEIRGTAYITESAAAP